MDSNTIIAKISMFNERNTIKYPVVQDIYSSDPFTATTYFIKWANKLKSHYFEIKSNIYNLTVVFTIYCRNNNDNIQHIIIVKTIFNNATSEYSYKIDNRLTDIDIENMGDIVSLVIRISISQVPYFKENNILNLINFQMERIANRIE